MQINEIVNDGLKREYAVHVEAAEIEKRLSKELERIRGQIRMPGFRPGKVPEKLVRQLHGEALQGQVLETTINETTRKLFDERKIKPAGQPNVEITKYDVGTDLEYKIAIEILPEVSSPDLSGLKLERLVAEVEDKQVDAMLERLAGQQKSFTAAAKSHKAVSGDAVLIDFVGKVDDVAFEGGAGEDYQLELGSGQFIPGFEDQLIGTKAGDQLAVNVTFPGDYGAKELAGKAAVFDVTVKEVRTATAAKVDDELAKNLGLGDLAALKDVIKQQLEREHARLSRSHLKRRVLDALAEEHDFAVPGSMVDAEFEQIWTTLLGQSSEEEKKALEADEKEKAEYRAIAERRVRLGLLLAQLGQDNKIDIRQEEVNRLISEEASRYPGQEKQVFEFYRKNPGAMAQLRAPLYEDKVIDFIIELVKPSDKKVSRAELDAALEADDAGETPAPAKKVKSAKKPAAKKSSDKKKAAKKSK